MGNRFNSQGATEGHKTQSNISSGSLKFGNGGRGETLEGTFKIGFCDFLDPFTGEKYSMGYFVNYLGLPNFVGRDSEGYEELKKKVFGFKREERKLFVVDLFGNKCPFYVYLGFQLDNCLNGKGMLVSWPTPEGIMSLDKFLGLKDKEIYTGFKSIGLDGDRLDDVMNVLRQYRNKR